MRILVAALLIAGCLSLLGSTTWASDTPITIVPTQAQHQGA